MKLIFLHGPPASGKYSIAKEIERVVPCKNFHNHLTIDVAKALFEFGTEPFHTLLRTIRLTAIEAAAKEDVGVLLMTYSYSHPHSLRTIQPVEEILAKYKGEFLPVYLQCDVRELERRVTQPKRKEMRKVSTVAGLHKHLNRWNCVAMPRGNCITIVTDGKTAVQSAQEIVQKLRLES